MRVAIYCRVSTSDQDCAMQLRELREYVKARQWVVSGEYVDAGISGAKASRPELNKLMADARVRRFDAVVCWKLDRWGRSLSNCIASIQELAGLGIRFIAATQGIDTDQKNPMATFFLHIMAAFAQMERSMILERVDAGVRNARANGVQFGRKPVIFRRDLARELHADGHSLAQIASACGVSIGAIRNELRCSIPQTDAAQAC